VATEFASSKDSSVVTQTVLTKSEPVAPVIASAAPEVLSVAQSEAAGPPVEAVTQTAAPLLEPVSPLVEKVQEASQGVPVPEQVVSAAEQALPPSLATVIEGAVATVEPVVTPATDLIQAAYSEVAAPPAPTLAPGLPNLGAVVANPPSPELSTVGDAPTAVAAGARPIVETSSVHSESAVGSEPALTVTREAAGHVEAGLIPDPSSPSLLVIAQPSSSSGVLNGQQSGAAARSPTSTLVGSTALTSGGGAPSHDVPKALLALIALAVAAIWCRRSLGEVGLIRAQPVFAALKPPR
jgi:MYXO-CTERM domain-containing protein